MEDVPGGLLHPDILPMGLGQAIQECRNIRQRAGEGESAWGQSRQLARGPFLGGENPGQRFPFFPQSQAQVGPRKNGTPHPEYLEEYPRLGEGVDPGMAGQQTLKESRPGARAPYDQNPPDGRVGGLHGGQGWLKLLTNLAEIVEVHGHLPVRIVEEGDITEELQVRRPALTDEAGVQGSFEPDSSPVVSDMEGLPVSPYIF